MLTVNVTGLTELRGALAEISDRRFNAALATGLTKTAVAVRDEVRAALPRVFDRPTPYTLNSMFVKGATAQTLEAKVWFKDDRGSSNGGTPATYYLLPNVEGGLRRAKRLEVALRAAGVIPDGWRIIPGQGARLDSYGNIDRGQIVQVLSQLRIQLLAGTTRNMSFDARSQIRAQRKAGGRFFVVRPGGKMQPGVYLRDMFGRNITPVFIFVSGAQYRKRFDFAGISGRVASARLQDEVNAALAKTLAKLKAKTS